MDSGLRIMDEFTQLQVFRARESTPWRADPKRASLDLICPSCRDITTDDYCTDHTVRAEVAVAETA